MYRVTYKDLDTGKYQTVYANSPEVFIGELVVIRYLHENGIYEIINVEKFDLPENKEE